MYWFWLSTVRNAISLLWSVGKMKFEAWPVLQGALVEQHHVGPAEAAEVADEAVADDAGADDDDLGGLRNRVGGNRVGKDCVGRILAHLNTPVERD